MNAKFLVKTAQHNRTSQQKRGKHPLSLVYESDSTRASVDEAVIRIAMSGTVLVMDAGNCFNPLRLVRAIRQQTLRINQVLENIQVARAFTCFQVLALLDQTIDPKGPVFIFRPLTTFHDEMAPVYERLRLLREVDRNVTRLQDSVAVTVMIRNSHLLEEPLMDWLTTLQGRADEVVFPKPSRISSPATFFISE